MNSSTKRILSLCLTVNLFNLCIGCVDGAGTGTDYNFIPDVQLDCSRIQAPLCQNDGATMYVGLIADASVDCETYLSQLTASTFVPSFDASGSGTGSVSGFYLTGLVTQWKNSLGATVQSLQEQTYRACAFVDVQPVNGQLDFNEPVGEGLATPGVTSATINDWFPSAQ